MIRGLIILLVGVTAALTPAFGQSSLTVSYFFAPSGALTDLAAADRIAFPATNIGASTTAVINILNRGTSAGSFQSAALSGTAFQLTGSPAPAQLQPGGQVSFQVTFAPQTGGGSQGLLVLTLDNSPISILLTGTGTSPGFTLTYALSDGNVRQLVDGVLVSFPAVDINGTTTANVEIANQGTGAGTVTSISLAAGGFRLSGVPLLPATVAAGQSLRFGIVFAPTQAGNFSGTFRIDMTGRSISGTVSGSTNVPTFNVSYSTTDGISRALFNGTAIAFPAIDVNATSTATIDIANLGPGAGQITGISVDGGGFRSSGVPVLPATVAPGISLRFGIVFAPAQTGNFSGTFRIEMTGRSITGTLTASTTAPNFSVSYALPDGIAHPVGFGTTISFPAVDINATTTANIEISNQGAGAGSITAISVGGAAFRLTGAPVLPASVAARQSLRFGIVFAPTQAGTFNGTFRIDVDNRSFSGTLTASTASANFSLAYIEPATNNTITLSEGATVPFANTLVNTVSSITLVATNSGAGTGAINSIALGGSSPSAFQLISLPGLPASVPPSQQVRFGVRFNPQQQQSYSASLALNFGGQSLNINLQARGTGSQFIYESSNGEGTAAFTTGGTLGLADTVVGQTASVTISVRNGGDGDGLIPAISVTGQGFSVSDLPTLPLTLSPNGSRSFTLQFAPTQPGAVSGRLTIGSDTFTVTATGIGARLTFSYSSAASPVPVNDGGAVIFPPIPVGKDQTLEFVIKNTGTSVATISSINLAASTTVFTLHQLPGMPFNLDPGATASFLIGFAPNNTGGLTATLRVNSSSFTLSGSGTQPESLPPYQFQGPSGNQQPAQQPAIGLTLATPYPHALQGSLRLTFASMVFTDDPAVQFATGGRTVNFTIPANSTRALFNGTATSVPLQTGTTAGNIVITPSFAMQGGFDLTPATPDALTLTVERTAPELLSVSVIAQTLNSFTLVVSGYSTTRALRLLEIQFTPRQGENFSTTRFTLDLASSASGWYQGTASQGFGGTFLVSIPFVLQNGSSTDDLVRRLQSLTITATNEIGASRELLVPIP
jgi:hypothetical protein